MCNSPEINTLNQVRNISKVKNQVILEGQKGLEKINLPNVYFAEQVGENTIVHLRDESIMVKEGLDFLETKLPEDTFVRVSGDHIINLDKVFIAKYPELIMADTGPTHEAGFKNTWVINKLLKTCLFLLI